MSRNVDQQLLDTCPLSVVFLNLWARNIGVLLFHARVGKRVFDPMAGQIRSKLSGLKMKFMLRAARSLLIRSVCLAIPRYMIQVVKLPIGTIDEVEKLN